MKKPSSSYRCPCGVTLSLIGGKYKIVILWHLYQKAPVRFNELHRLIPEATTKMFTQQLRELRGGGPPCRHGGSSRRYRCFGAGPLMILRARFRAASIFSQML